MPSPPLPKDLRRVVIAAAVGNVIEWYDFYIFGSLAALLATKFFAEGASGAALIKTVGPPDSSSGRSALSCSAGSAISWAANTHSSSP